MSKLGRRPKLTKAAITKLCEAREIGASHDVAAIYAGVTPTSLTRWLQAAREIRDRIEDSADGIELSQDESLLLSLLTRVEKADAFEAISLLQVVDKAAQNDPGVAYKLLQQQKPGAANPRVPKGRVVTEWPEGLLPDEDQP